MRPTLEIRRLSASRLIYTGATGKTGQRYDYFLCRTRQDGLCDLPHLGLH